MAFAERMGRSELTPPARADAPDRVAQRTATGYGAPPHARPAWVARAERVTVRRLEGDVERMLLLRAGAPFAFGHCLHHPERAQDPALERDRQTGAHGAPDPEETEELVFRVPFEVAALFRAVRETLRTRLRARVGRPPTDGEIFASVKSLAAFVADQAATR